MARGNQIVRQWQLLRLLGNSRVGMRVAELAQQLEATERTVFRDLKDLEAAGFPLQSVQGRWRAESGPEVSLPVTEDDLVGLSLGLAALAPVCDRLNRAGALASLVKKVAAALPESARKLGDALRATQLATLTAPSIPSDTIAEALEEASSLEQCVDLRYRAFDGSETTRRIDPYVLWFADGALHVIAYCHLRRAMRHFAVARIQSAELTDVTFERDPGFDPELHIAGGFGVWVGEQHDITLEFSAPWAHLAQERQFHSSQAVEERADGSTLVRFTSAGLPAVARYLASYGGAVRVLAPLGLRDMVRSLHLAGLEAQGLGTLARTTPKAKESVVVEATGSERPGSRRPAD